MKGRRDGVAPVSAVEKALAWRARAALEAGPGDRPGPTTAPAPELLESLRHHLHAGETHYPDRPGMAELRRLVGAALPGAGYPARGPDGVLITASEGESLFVTLLGLGVGKGDSFTGSAPARHRRLFDWMGVVPGEPDAAGRIHAIGDRLFRPGDQRHPDDALAHVIVIGSLDGLEAMHPFRLGFVAAPPETLARITKWKQASSICSPAPSQRAALWALGVRP